MSLYPFLAATPHAAGAEVGPVTGCPLRVPLMLMQKLRVNGVPAMPADIGRSPLPQ